MSAPVRVNFHCHSSFSDGSLPPEKLAHALADAGVRCAALVDHHSTQGLPAFVHAAARRGVATVTGVEISIREQPTPIHLLAYGFDPENSALQALLRQRAAGNSQPGDAADAIGVVHRAGGTVFLAHPQDLGDELEACVDELKAAGLDGLEAIYAPYPLPVRHRLEQLAARHGLLVSAGTDFHGFDRPGLNRLGVDMPLAHWLTFGQALRLPEEPDPPASAAASGNGLLRRRALGPPALHWRRFAVRIILPTLLTLALFLSTVFAFILPTMRQSLLDRKREMIRELTNAAWSILADSEREARTGVVDLAEAQRRAIARIQSLHYGRERKDYFWLTDGSPRMLMHPYRTDLNGADLTNFTDVNGRRLFVEFARVAREKGEGYVRYYWQWNDNPDRLVPKQSFVKHFPAWDWVIGTGIYLDDVNEEIDSLTSSLTWFSVGISAIAMLLLALVTRESLSLERRRGEAEADLRASYEKYAAMVEAATEGTLMVLDGQCAYANKTLCDMLGYSEQELSHMGVRGILPLDDASAAPTLALLEALEEGRPAPPAFEAELRGKDGQPVSVVLTLTRVAFAGRTGFIIVARDLGRSARLGRSADRDTTLEELQTALLFLNEPLGASAQTLHSCPPDTSVQAAAAMMSEAHCTALAVTEPGQPRRVVGIVTDRDIRQRAVSAGVELTRPVREVMSTPVIALPASAPVYEALLAMQENAIHHLVVQGDDGAPISVVRNTDLIQFHQYSSAVITSQIRKADSVPRIVEVRQRFPRMVSALLECGALPRNITRITSRLTDAIVDRLLTLAAADLGPAPAAFCFVALGSEGRAEQTLVTDQDNALIYVDPEARPDHARDYFLALGRRACDMLAQAGYALCPGNIMAGNPHWCRPMSAWKKQAAQWITTANPQDLLEISTFFDLRPVVGEHALVTDLRRFIHETIAAHPSFLLHLAQTALSYRPPIGLFGQLVAGSSGPATNVLNLKEAALTLVHFARLYALQHRLDETNTLDRLHKLNELGVLKEPLYNETVDAYAFLVRLRLQRQNQAIADGRSPDNLLGLSALHQMDQTMLKQAFAVVSSVRRKISYDFLGMSSPIT